MFIRRTYYAFVGIVAICAFSVFGGEVGYHTVYGNTSSNTNRNALPVTMTENGDIVSISIYHGDVASGQMQFAVYTDASNAPGTKLSATTKTNINTTQGWQTIDLNTPVYVASGTKIWLAWMFQTNPQAHWVGNVTGSQGYVRDDNSTWSESGDNMPSSWENVRAVSGVNFSIFATFTTGSGTYTLTVNSSGDGIVAKDPDKSSYSNGESITLTATAGTGSEFSGWSGDLNGTINPITFNINKNMTVNATFSPVQTYTLTINITGSGTVTKTPDKPLYNSGETVTLTAEEGDGYEFDGWTGDATGSVTPLTITMNSNKNITAAFSVLYAQEPWVRDNNFVYTPNIDDMVGIGVPAPTEKLEVAGTVKCNAVKINGWTLNAPDYVFAPGYKKPTIAEVEQYIKKNRHLPGVKSAAEIKENGLDLVEMNMILLQKIEELTLYAIEQQKQIQELNKKIGK
ncbi:MAG: InlB B-repeat-containing protein [Chitinispirillaceae bacterium]|nr:InlB B-repeat-containing protein [Chitinispirillaceae bacterium]